MTKKYLDEAGVKYTEINLDEQLEFVAHVMELGFMQAPVVETEARVFSGFHPVYLRELVANA
jgi:glutaredoxin-like protein NrdH